VICTLSIKVGDAWISKEDGGENSDIEPVKGGLSDAFKRAAVSWGIGRYLYGLDTGWHAIQEGWANGKGIDISTKGAGHTGWVPYPKLPAWALPTPAGKAAEPRPASSGAAPTSHTCAKEGCGAQVSDALAKWCTDKGLPIMCRTHVEGERTAGAK
jgi:hypothetical protein